MQSLIDGLLSYSRTGRSELVTHRVDLNDTVNRALGGSLGVDLESPTQISSLEICPVVGGDAGQLDRLFENLLSNAVKFRQPDGQPLVKIGATLKGGAWHFFVADNGIGIDERHRERIFNVFERLHGAGDYAGTGIGLSICKKVVERHGGRIWVEETAGWRQHLQIRPAGTRRRGTRAVMPIEPIKILLVEDQPADVRLTEEVLKQGKVANELYVAEDGEKAMQFLRQEGAYEGVPRPDLVILDLNLPRMDGKEVLQAIKGDPAFLKIPVLMLTTSAAERDILDAYSHHVNAYITKPIDLDEFVAVVSSIEQFWLSIVRLPDGIEENGGTP